MKYCTGIRDGDERRGRGERQKTDYMEKYSEESIRHTAWFQLLSQCVVNNTAFHPNNTIGKWQHCAHWLAAFTVCVRVLVCVSVAVFVQQQE